MQCAALARSPSASPACSCRGSSPTGPGGRGRPPVGEGPARLVWMLSYLPGRPIAGLQPVTPELLGEIGEALARLDLALTGFSHPAARRELKWDLVRAGWIREHLDTIREPAAPRPGREGPGPLRRRGHAGPAAAETAASSTPTPTSTTSSSGRTGTAAAPGRARRLRRHGRDRVRGRDRRRRGLCGVRRGRPARGGLPARRRASIAFFRSPKTRSRSLDVLIRTRLAVSVVNSACRAAAEPEDPYLSVSEAPAWAALEAFEKIPPRLAHYAYRDACGLPPAPHGPAVARWLEESAGSFAQVLEHDLRADPVVVLDLSVGSRMLGADPSNLETPRLSETIAKVDERRRRGRRHRPLRRGPGDLHDRRLRRRAKRPGGDPVSAAPYISAST